MRDLHPSRHIVILLDPNIHLVARGNTDLTFTVQEFGDGGGRFCFETEADDNLSVRYLDNLTLHNLSWHQRRTRKRFRVSKQFRHVTAFGSTRGERAYFDRLFRVSSNLL